MEKVGYTISYGYYSSDSPADVPVVLKTDTKEKKNK